MTALKLQNLHPELQQYVKIRTVQHRLQKDLDLQSCKPAKKPLITERMKTKRLAFAKKYSHWTTEQWRKMMLFDERNFQVFKMGSTTMRHPRSSDRFDPRYIVLTVKLPLSVMVWKCFSEKKGRGGLYFLPKNKKMNAEVYLQVLEEHMLNFYDIHGSEVIIHDSASCHKARKITRYLEQKQLNVLEWPGNSSDLNPIENCWHKMKNKISEKKTPNLEILQEELKKVWCQEMSMECLKNLSDSMPKRLQMVIKNKGSMTKY